MLKKSVSLIFCFLFFINTLHASSVDSLKTAYNELQYALTVEWDQKDQSFKKEHTEIFAKKIQELLDQGLSVEELSSFALNQIKSESSRKEIETILSLIKINHLERSKAQQLIKNALNKSLSTGTSWNARISLLDITSIIVIVALVVSLGNRPKNSHPVGAQPDGSYCGYRDTQQCYYKYDHVLDQWEWDCRYDYYCIN